MLGEDVDLGHLAPRPEASHHDEADRPLTLGSNEQPVRALGALERLQVQAMLRVEVFESVGREQGGRPALDVPKRFELA